MSDGNVHARDAIVVASLVTTYNVVQYGPEHPLFYAGVIGSVLGIFITPDTDLEGTTWGERQLRRIPIFGVWFQAKMFPYALTNNHRGRSHVIIVGTLERLFYLLFGILETVFAIVGIMYWFGYASSIPTIQVHIPWFEVAYALAIWMFQDAVHIGRDRMSDLQKRRRKKRR